MSSFRLFFCKECHELGHPIPKCALLRQDFFSQSAIIRSKDTHKLATERTPSNINGSKYSRFGRLCGLGRGTSSSSDRNTEVSQKKEDPAPNPKQHCRGPADECNELYDSLRNSTARVTDPATYTTGIGTYQ